MVPAAAKPGGWPEPAYYRLHGSPRKYFSSYEEESIGRLASALEEAEGEVWCIFDNTASGAAAGDALNLLAAHGEHPVIHRPRTTSSSTGREKSTP